MTPSTAHAPLKGPADERDAAAVRVRADILVHRGGDAAAGDEVGHQLEQALHGGLHSRLRRGRPRPGPRELRLAAIAVGESVITIVLTFI